jgi:hypothetical protein
MPANLFAGDDTDSGEYWDACWCALESLPGSDLPTVAMHAEAARIINSCRAVTDGRGIERIEERAQVAYRLASDRLPANSAHLNRLRLAMGGALSVLRGSQSPAAPSISRVCRHLYLLTLNR